MQNFPPHPETPWHLDETPVTVIDVRPNPDEGLDAVGGIIRCGKRDEDIFICKITDRLTGEVYRFSFVVPDGLDYLSLRALAPIYVNDIVRGILASRRNVLRRLRDAREKLEKFFRG